MWRLLLAATVAIVTVFVWWLSDGRDIGQSLSDMGDRIVDQAIGTPPPSWGDVADKVGEFAREERDLKRTVSGLGGPAVTSPPVDPPAQ